MDKTKEEFIHFIRDAMADKKSDSFVELYNFLLGCFVRADSDFDGKVFIDQFDMLIEEAAALPRKHGLAPKASDMYPTLEARKTARAQMFNDMNFHHDGYITLEEWIDFSVKHIMGKAKTLGRDYLGGDCTKGEFITFIKKAVIKSNQEYHELFFFLLKCFTDADRDHDGAVNHKEFDAMIEEAAQAPRKHGLAPLSRVMFKTDAERLAARAEYFRVMDTNKDDTISFDEWLKYAMDHIMGKVAALK
jgi:uncharacterized protein YqcC (DUF446 family)